MDGVGQGKDGAPTLALLPLNLSTATLQPLLGRAHRWPVLSTASLDPHLLDKSEKKWGSRVENHSAPDVNWGREEQGWDRTPTFLTQG